jgi:carbonic anhydrase
MSEIEQLLANNADYAASFRGGLPSPPAKAVAVVACMDARLNVYAALGLAQGDAHVIRNAGGVVTDDVIRSLSISQRLLGTTDVVLVHHTDCGMSKVTDDEFRRSVQDDVGEPPPWDGGFFTDVDESVRESIRRIAGSPYVPHTDAIRGFVFDVSTGRLREVPPSPR